MPNPVFTFRNYNSRSLLNFTFRGVIDVCSFPGLLFISSAVSSLRLPAKAQESKYFILAHDQRDESYFLLFLNTSVIQIKATEGPANINRCCGTLISNRATKSLKKQSPTKV